MNKTYTIHDIAEEFNRIAIGRFELLGIFGILISFTGVTQGDGTSTIYLTKSQPLLAINNQDIQRTGETLTKMKKGVSLQNIQQALTEAGIQFKMFPI